MASQMKAAGKPKSPSSPKLPNQRTSAADASDRQHFQGLRRAQQKAEANGALMDNPRKIDPTLNPITRRPGPGRGRPRKSTSGMPCMPGAPPQGPEGLDPNQPQQQPLDPHHLVQMPQPLPPQAPMDPSLGPAPTPLMDTPSDDIKVPPPPDTVVMPTDDVGEVLGVDGVPDVDGVEGVGGVDAVDGVDGNPFDETSEEPDEHVAKRAKIEENHDPALNDEAILSALAAHTNPADDYNTELVQPAKSSCECVLNALSSFYGEA